MICSMMAYGVFNSDKWPGEPFTFNHDRFSALAPNFRLIGLTHTAALETVTDSVKVTAICPGPIHTQKTR